MADNANEPVSVAAPEDDGYPPYVVTDENKRRWDACVALATQVYGDLDAGEQMPQVWSATRAYYHSDMPTGDESEREPAA